MYVSWSNIYENLKIYYIFYYLHIVLSTIVPKTGQNRQIELSLGMQKEQNGCKINRVMHFCKLVIIFCVF